MNRRLDIDQQISTWLADEAGMTRADYLEETLVLLDRTPQRRWTGALRRGLRLPLWRPVVPRPLVYAALVALLVLALVAAALLIGSQRRLPPPFGLADNGLVAYDDGVNVYLANADGSGQREIVGGLGFEWNATFSPDGTLVAFWSTEYFGQRGALFVAHADGAGEATRLAEPSVQDDPDHVPPAWSPDSRHIAYVGFAPGNLRGVLVATVGDAGPPRYVAGDRQNAGFPAWSPSGDWIAYRSVFDGRTRLMIVHPDGSGLRELASSPGEVNAFTQIGWSPTDQLVYHRPHESYGGQTVVATYDVATDLETVVSDPARYADAPTWSTDGARVAYMVDAAGEGETLVRHLVIASADGSVRTDRGPIAGCLAHFSPDAEYLIAYPVDCFGTAEILVIDADDPSAPARHLSLPGNIKGGPSWQRIDDGQ